MISAPRSASTWVPKGPAPNWETARMRTPSRRGLDGDDAAVALLRLSQLQHAATGVQRVADEVGLLVFERVHLEIGDGAPRDVGDAHPDDDAIDQRPQHHALLVLGVRLGVVRVRMQRVLVHGQQRKPRAVGLRDGAPRPVLELLPHRELFEVAPVAHGVPASMAWRAMARRRVSAAARSVRRRETAMAVAMSASMSWTAWCWQIGTPKAQRCWE